MDRKVDVLKRQIASRTYEVDADEVAKAILVRLVLIRSGRQALAATDANADAAVDPDPYLFSAGFSDAGE